MPETVSRDVIDQRVVREWCRLMKETAEDRGDTLSSVQPFHPLEQTYGEVMEAVRAGSHRGLAFYQRMILFTPGYTFGKE